MSSANSLLAAGIVLVTILLVPCVALGYVDKFEVCRHLALDIIEGNRTYGDINNITIWELDPPYIYSGSIRGLDLRYPRADILTLT